ncbi:MAG: hypothetical protein AAFV53_26785 [Myxococcota bacterium]
MGRLRLHSCEVDLETGWIWIENEQSRSRLNEVLLNLFNLLVRRAGGDVSHDELRQTVWNDRLDMETHSDRKQKMRKVYIAVTRLRRAIRDDVRPYRHVVSSHVGYYRFEPLGEE